MKLKGLSTLGKYTAATFEYSGLILCSWMKMSGKAVKKSGTAVKDVTCKVTNPVARSLGNSCGYVRIKSGGFISKTSDILTGKKRKLYQEKIRVLEEKVCEMEKSKEYKEKIEFLENKIKTMEERVAYIEEHGVTRKNAVKEVKEVKKEISAAKRMLLQTIVNENKMLKV
uniref:Magnetosome protein Mad11 n=1 Tax=Candidatus Magnetananas rongchengensis TaxID=1463558 RepID=A0A3Q8BC43_9BACT|nr:magnetosome protein Mad11 [Candidatus Magnetananas rongchenensis]